MDRTDGAVQRSVPRDDRGELRRRRERRTQFERSFVARALTPDTDLIYT